MLVSQSYPILCDPMDCSPSDSSVQGFLTRILEWVAISFSRRFSSELPGKPDVCIYGSDQKQQFLAWGLWMREQWRC